MVSATTGDVEGSKQACVKGTSARFSRAKRASLLLEKHATIGSLQSCPSRSLAREPFFVSTARRGSTHVYVVELRESADSKQKRKTAMVPVPADGALAYGDAFDFDVAAGHAGELRVQLFKKTSALAPNAKTAVANAGVYVKNIVSHIAAHGVIDKDFKLFSKGGEASGGFVRLRVAFEAFEEDAAGDAGGDAGGDADVAAAPADSEAAQKAAATIQASWKGKKTRDGVRFLSREKKETKKSNGSVSPFASVAAACGAVALAAFAASVGVTRGRRRRRAA